MLTAPQITAFLPTIDPIKSKHFYKNVLGLNLKTEDNYALEFQGKGTLLRITVVNELEPQPFTVLGFKIDNIDIQVSTLIGKGVTFNLYDQFEQNNLGIWTAPSGAKVAWFHDPDGNLLSLTEYPE
jgi:catechol 2,3-dioxygenase-like lactoylglutathione lyase family enzyme